MEFLKMKQKNVMPDSNTKAYENIELSSKGKYTDKYSNL